MNTIPSNPKISVVIPSFNSADTLPCAIESVFLQSRSPYEVIVVDDGSTDATSDLVSKWNGKITYIRQENFGVAVARQRGSEAATGEYIAYLDADDWWPTDRIARAAGMLLAESIDVLFGDLVRSGPDRNLDSGTYSRRNSEFFPGLMREMGNVAVKSIAHPCLWKLDRNSAQRLFLAGYPLYPSTLIVRKEALLEVGGWDGRFRRCQDFDLALRASRSFPIHYLNEVSAVLGIHRVNADEKAYLLKQLPGDIEVLRSQINDNGQNWTHARRFENALGGKYRALAYVQRLNGEYRASASSYLSAAHLPGRKVHSYIRGISLLLVSMLFRKKVK